jgi:hypothetical protein
MPKKDRSKLRRRRHWPYCQYCGTPQHPHGPYAYPPHHGQTEKLTPEEEREDLKEYIEIMKEEIKDAEEQLKGPGKSKKNS